VAYVTSGQLLIFCAPEDSHKQFQRWIQVYISSLLFPRQGDGFEES